MIEIEAIIRAARYGEITKWAFRLKEFHIASLDSITFRDSPELYTLIGLFSNPFHCDSNASFSTSISSGVIFRIVIVWSFMPSSRMGIMLSSESNHLPKKRCRGRQIIVRIIRFKEVFELI